MKVVVVFALFVAAAFAVSLEGPFGQYSVEEQQELFNAFNAKFNKPFFEDSAAYYKTFGVFRKNLAKIDALNAASTHTKFGITEFADLTQDEFKKFYLGTHPIRDENVPEAPLYSEQQLQDIPKSFDWRPKGAVTPIKNQGQCGSCWAFSTTGNVEGQHFLATGHLVGLSEQNLVDCDHHCMQYDGEKSCDAGCQGGLQPNAFMYIMGNGGIDTESSYPYEAVDGTCHFKKADVGATINNYTMISKDEDQMAAYLVEHGPISIAADAVEWQFYIGGVFDGPCGTSLDHGILIVGYGEETDDFGYKINYWWVKNSWGTDWGISGYMKIIRGVGECGLNLFVSSSIINK